MADQQTYANHTRWFPLVHFVTFPLLILNLIYQSVRLYQDPSADRVVWVVLSVALMLIVFTSRLQALKAQDRVIRLEELIRYNAILPADLVKRAQDMPVGKIIALRFAPDEELPQLIEQVLAGKLTTSQEVKMAIKNWKADHMRV